MGEVDKDKRPFITLQLAQAWATGKEPIPDDIKERLKPWSQQEGGSLADAPSSVEETEAWFKSMPPRSNDDLLGDQVLGKVIDNAMSDINRGLPDGSTTWAQALRGDPLAKGIIKRQARRRKGKSP